MEKLPDGVVSQDSQPLCIICQVAVKSGQRTRQLPCGHNQWHEHCILRWLTRRLSCPICRAKAIECDSAAESDTEDESDPEDVVSEAIQLAQRRIMHLMRELDAHRQVLEVQVRILEQDLQNSRALLVHLNSERLALCRELRLLAASPGHDFHRLMGYIAPTTRTQHIEFDPTRVLPGAFCHEVAENSGAEVDADMLACAMIARLRCAVLRAPCPGAEVFRALAMEAHRLGPKEVCEVLLGLNAAAPRTALARAFALLDVDASGFVELSDWMAALQLPRVEVQRLP